MTLVFILRSLVRKHQTPLEKLDNTDFKLCLLKTEGHREVATLFIPEARRGAFLRKVNQYLNPDKDRYKESEDTYYPANHTLIASIAEVRFARIRSFWTDEPSLFPDDPERFGGSFGSRRSKTAILS
jgi:hypothetical protein